MTIQLIDKRTFQSEMEVNGRISVEPQEDWLTLRLKSVSTEDMKKELGKVKNDQRKQFIINLNYYINKQKNNLT